MEENEVVGEEKTTHLTKVTNKLYHINILPSFKHCMHSIEPSSN